jgi:NhaP-type Na+/H+ or K+/H+ antiporter
MVFIGIYLVRILLLKVFAKQGTQVLEYVAPRGLITILLFYSIPEDLISNSFQPGVILWVIILTSIYMTFGLIRRAKEPIETEAQEEL